MEEEAARRWRSRNALMLLFYVWKKLDTGYRNRKVTNSGLAWVCAGTLWHVGHRIVTQ